MKNNVIFLILLSSVLNASGGYDNGTSTGKGKFQLDITLNPFNRISFGQSYTVMSYGITDKFDFHGYISQHQPQYYTYYVGMFYQFINTNNLDIATAIGVRKRFDQDWMDLFFPQLLFTKTITDKINIGGSIVGVNKNILKKGINAVNTAIDISISYKLKYETKIIESVSVVMGGFHPAEWEKKQFFLPTYSIDIKFK